MACGEGCNRLSMSAPCSCYTVIDWYSTNGDLGLEAERLCTMFEVESVWIDQHRMIPKSHLRTYSFDNCFSGLQCNVSDLKRLSRPEGFCQRLHVTGRWALDLGLRYSRSVLCGVGSGFSGTIVPRLSERCCTSRGPVMILETSRCSENFQLVIELVKLSIIGHGTILCLTAGSSRG